MFHFPRLPDWLVYAAVVIALALAALGRRENADAPEAPPPPTREEGALLAPVNGFAPSIVVKTGVAPDDPQSGTAFSVSSEGVWLTARHVVEHCRQVALMERPGKAAAARLAPEPLGPGLSGAAPSDIAVLLTEGGAPALPLSDGKGLRIGERGFHPGYPQGTAGEATSRLLGRQTLLYRGRKGANPGPKGRAEPVLAWAEAGRTDGMRGGLSGLSGAPVLDGRGVVIGVTLAEAPRRGRLYTTGPEAMSEALVRARKIAVPAPMGDPVTVENYGRASDSLRRDLRVAQVVCLSAK